MKLGCDERGASVGEGTGDAAKGSLKVYGYMRVSPEDRAPEEVSLPVQKRQIEAYCRAKGFTLAGFFIDDGVSEWIPIDERPMGEKLCMQFQCGDHVVLARYDRAFRNLIDTLERTQSWLAKGVVTHFVSFCLDTSTPFWRIAAPAIETMMKLDRDHKSARTKKSLIERRRRGQRWANRPPIGSRYARDPAGGWSRRGNSRMIVVVDDAWMGQIELIVKWRDADHMTFTDVARRFIYRKEKPKGGIARDWSEFLVRDWYVNYESQRTWAQRAAAS